MEESVNRKSKEQKEDKNIGKKEEGKKIILLLKAPMLKNILIKALSMKKILIIRLYV